jgi:hypothetical protein
VGLLLHIHLCPQHQHALENIPHGRAGVEKVRQHPLGCRPLDQGGVPKDATVPQILGIRAVAETPCQGVTLEQAQQLLGCTQGGGFENITVLKQPLGGTGS